SDRESRAGAAHGQGRARDGAGKADRRAIPPELRPAIDEPFERRRARGGADRLTHMPYSPIHDLTAILLCGGKGERLRPFTDTLPKPLVPLNGRPLLYYLMKYLADEGVNRFIVCVGYKADAIERFLSTECPPQWE